jgi:hypothetical protein
MDMLSNGKVSAYHSAEMGMVGGILVKYYCNVRSRQNY